jgi:hypothetical protein
MLLTLSDFSKVNPELENISNRALHFEKCWKESDQIWQTSVEGSDDGI